MLSITIFLKLLRENVESNPGMKQNSSMISVLTYNCNGLGDPKKLKRLLTKLTNKVDQSCIVFLQETHIIDTSYLNTLWQNKFESNCSKTNSAGVIILYKNSFDLIDSYKDVEGRHLTIVLKSDDRYHIATNVYFPNDHKKGIIFAEQVYLKILEFQHKYPDNYTLLAGDFNTCMSEKDYLNRNSSLNEKILSEIIAFNNKTTSLVDAYRTIHKVGGYTWNRGKCYSRLDYIYISSNLIPNIVKEHNWNFETSDHAALKIDFVLNESPVRGPGIIKVNLSILDDPKIAIQIKNELNTFLEQVDNSWNPHTTLEFLKVAIRSVFSAKVSELRKHQYCEISETEEEINQLELLKIKILTGEKRCGSEDKVTSIDLAIQNLKVKLQHQRNTASNKQQFRSKAKWLEYGEKPNKFFLNLLKSRQNQKLISKIKSNGKEYKGQKEVEAGITNFYKDLYDSKVREFIEEDDYYKNCPKLNNDQIRLMDQELTLANLHEALKTCKDSSPGPDGIPYLIYKKYWDITGPIILKSWQYSKEIGKLAPSHNESVITLLPKEGKDMGDIKNWRPITLSNCDSKIITKALTIKISKVLDSIIDVSQTAYVPGRSVAYNLRFNFYLKSYCKNNNIEALLVSLDAKKAFDSVDHKYITETLRAYGFGEDFIKTFNILQKDISARILVNGFLSESINIKHGVKQGDSLSCAIFIICIEPLLRNINNSNKIISINPCRNIQTKQSKKLTAGAYADNISAICIDEKKTIQEIFNEYSRLTVRSGLELNADKTEILRLNTDVPKTMSFTYNSQDVEIETVKVIKTCGLYYSYCCS
jgi:exonuclease III